MINAETLAFTVGKDPELDRRFVAADCIGTAAHVVMLSGLKIKPPLITRREKKSILRELTRIIRQHEKRPLKIAPADQDVHLAIERLLTEKLGDTGRKIHTGRSRNDQIAVDVRLFTKEQILALAEETGALGEALMRLAKREKMTPMVGRTHLQPAMPSSVGLWASAHAESLLDDLELIKTAYLLNDRCPLGSAAGYGVPLAINRRQVSDLLGFRRPIHNVLYAGNTRGKIEGIVLCAASQLMATLSRLAQDLIIFSMPEFNYFCLPKEMCTGSSIMPQKNNPDILELIRAKAARVISHALATMEISRGLTSGYNRDLQETKEPLINGLDTARESVRIMIQLINKIEVNRKALTGAFTPPVFAADLALALTAKGMPFRNAYRHVKEHLDELALINPLQAIQRKRHLGATGGLDLKMLEARISGEKGYFRNEQSRFYRQITRLLGIKYPYSAFCLPHS
jgi:argininosuccinate lyase